MISKEGIEDFFNQYSSMMNNALFDEQFDVNAIMNSFSDFVVGANPMGVMGGKNDEQFAKAILGGIDFYKRIGIISMNMVASEVQILDDVHAVVKIFWSCFYENKNGAGEIPFEVVYVVQCRDGQHRIFAYVTGDEQAAFRHHKLIPENAEYDKQD